MSNEKSLAMQERGKRRIPGMTQLLSKRPDMFSLGVWPGYYQKAEGCRVWDLDGNEYLDMSISGIGACILGYADPDVDAAVVEAVRNGVASSLNCPEEVELAELLCELHPWADMARFTRAGGEAMAVAVRIARAHTGRDVVAFCGYHGWQDWYLAANLADDSALDGHLLPGLDPAGVPRGLKGTALPFEFNRLDQLQAIARDNKGRLAAIVMEPVREHDPEPGFVEGVRALADETGAVMIVDEISAGLRLTTGGAHLVVHTVSPDMAVFSKAMGNGYAMSAVIGREAVMQSAQKTFVSSTNWTERIGPTAALATLRKHRERNVPAHLDRIGGLAQAGWTELGEKHGIDLHVGGLKPMSHFVFRHEQGLAAKAYFIQCMLERGILASNLLYATYAHQESDLERYLAACDQCFGLVAEALDAGNLDARLKGRPSGAGFKRLT